MRIEANRAELLKAAQCAEQIAPAASPVDILRCTCLETENGRLVVAATNAETAVERRIPVTVQEEGQAAINARLLVEMLSRLGGESVVIAQEHGGQVSVTSGEAAYRIPAQAGGRYPRAEIPFPEDTVAVRGIPAMAKRTAFAVSTEESRPLMKCVCLKFSTDGLRAVGTDGFRIASAKGESKSAASVSLLIPASSLERLARLVEDRDELKVGVTGKTVVFMKEDLVFSARLMDGKYVDVDMVLNGFRPRFTVLTDADALRKAVLSVCAGMGKQNRFRLSFQTTCLKAVCESEYGVSSSEMEVTALSGVPSGDCWFNVRQLLDCLRAQRGTMTLEVAPNGAMMLRTDELICVQMQIREPKPVTPKKPAEGPVQKDAAPKPKIRKTKKEAAEEKAA